MLFDHPEFRGHEMVLFVSDPASGLKAVIAIHRTLRSAGGGIRMQPYDDEERAVTDALRLSRAMTYKFALANLPVGGAKTVVIGNPATEKSDDLLKAIGKALNRLGGLYVAGPDVGTNPADMEVIRQVSAHVRGGAGVDTGTSDATAFGVVQGMLAAVAYKLDRPTLNGLRVAVQGTGSVGEAICRYLHAKGARLSIADRDQAAAARVAHQYGAAVISPEEILTVDADIVSPCALGGILNDETVPRLNASIICGAANNQLAEDRHGEMIRDRGILYVPDYAINAGGTIKAIFEGPDYDRERVYARLSRIADTARQIFERADRDDIPTNIAADQLAEEAISIQQL